MAGQDGEAGANEKRQDDDSEANDELFGDNARVAVESSSMPQEEAQEEVTEENDFICEPCGPRFALPDPGQPTQSQIEEHRIDHLPYRSWCAECVSGRATGEPHRKRHEDTRGVSVFNFGYLCITKSRVASRRDMVEGEDVVLKILVAQGQPVSSSVRARSAEQEP